VIRLESFFEVSFELKTVFNFHPDYAYGSYTMRMLSLPDFLFIENMNLDEKVISIPEIIDLGAYFYKPDQSA
jgi:hypothetical protein